MSLVEDEDLKPNKSFSIIFRGSRTLDLMMPYGDRNVVLDALDLVLKAYQAAKVKVAKDVLLLRYVWLDVDKGMLSWSYPIVMLHRVILRSP
jgi:hypothetical protein